MIAVSPKAVDVCLVHAPSIYDFRKRELRSGPISDLVPSTPVFEMYPIGFVSMLGYLVKHGYNARIANLAVLMLSDRSFDPVSYLKNIDAEVFGLDLHWLPHIHGVYEVSKLIREIHPESKILLGGFSATYFKEEIMKKWPWIDFVLYGDYQEDPLLQLTDAVEHGKNLETIRNLVYRDENGRIKVTQQEDSEIGMSRVFIDYEALAHNTVKYHDIRGHLPYYAWIENPEGFTVIEHGCKFNCGFCGGSNFAYVGRYGSHAPIFRNPDVVAREIELVDDIIGSPVFVVGDLNAAGEKYYTRFFKRTKERGIDVPLLTEYFVPPDRKYLTELSRNFPGFTAEISAESSVYDIRRVTGKFYSNAALEKSIEIAEELGCKKFDLYFSIGLPQQRREDVFADVEYSEKIMNRYQGKGMSIYTFISPLAPFLDPGSLFYEMPERYGYTVHGKQLMDFYNALEKGSSWEDYINYENGVMTKKDMVETTYLVGIKMIELAKKMNIIDGYTSSYLIRNIHDYLSGNPYLENKDPSKHLAYVNKQIEWSSKHHVTYYSFLLLLYKYYISLVTLMRKPAF